MIEACRDRLDRGERVDFESEAAARPHLAARLRPAFALLARLDRVFPAREAASLVGAALGPWRVTSRLGAGGMGEVFRCEDAGGAVAAVKVIHAHLLGRAGFLERFRREALLGRRIRHDNVVATLDAADWDAAGATRHCLVMEYVFGQTLRAMLDDLGRLPEDLCRHVGREVAKGLAAIHAAGVVHRDLKPDNVIICAPRADGGVAKREGRSDAGANVPRAGHAPSTSEHVVKVMDLGVARLVDEAARLSQTGAFVGSFHYAAPEQFRRGGKDVDHRADLFALGLLLYELATGTHPFPDDDLRVVIRRLLDERPRPIAELNPQLSPFFEEVVAKLLAKDPDARFASADEVARVLADGDESAWWAERAKSIRETTHRPLRRIRIPRETALYGREAELALLSALFERASEGDGQVAVIEGEAGIGKSRLVDEFVGRLAQSGEDVNFLYGSYPPGGAATASGAFTSAYREQLGDDDASIRKALPRTPLLVAAFAALLRGDVAPADAVPLTKDALQTVFVHATRSFAAERPTIVLIDDLHFAPEEGRALFASLALAVPDHRVLLVGCARPSLDEKWVAQLASRPQTTRLAVPRLGPKELVRLLRDALKSERLAEELASLIALKSDGNPFFVFELLRGLRNGRFLRQKQDGAWETTQIIRDIQVPSSIAELVQARVADLDAEDKNLVDVAACCGFEFDPLIVAAALGVAQIPAMQRLARIEKRQRLVRSAGRRFVFDHHQVQEALYAGMPELLREPYHAAVAHAVEARSGAASKEPKEVDGAVCVELAEHFLRGAKGERAIRYLGAAFDHLEKGCLHDAAVRLADRALAAPGLVAARERCALLLRKVGRLEHLGRRDAQRDALMEANALADAAGDAALRVRTLRLLGNVHTQLSHHDEARKVLGEALEMARAVGDRKEEATATGNLGTVFQRLGRPGEAREHHERHLAIAREMGDRHGEALATGNLGIALLNLGRLSDAREHHERHLALAREIGDREGEMRATGNLGVVLFNLARLGEAQAHYERYLALSREIGSRWGEANATGNLGNVFLSLGRLSEAMEHYERHSALSREIGNRTGEADAVGNLGVVFWKLGRLGQARVHFEQYLALAREIGHRRGEAMATGNLGNVVWRLGRLEQARELHERFLTMSREIGDRWIEGYALGRLADVSAEERDSAAAERRCSESLALRRDMGLRDGEAETLVARGAHLAQRGRVSEAGADLDAALAIARELSLPNIELLATARLATLSGVPQHGLVPPGDKVAAALAAFAAHEGRADLWETMEARFLLWQATRDPAHLAEAKRLLDFVVEHAPADCRESMLANVRLHREIAAAARDEGIPPAAEGVRAGDERADGSAGA